ncbi:MAG: hypothetical protein K9N48_08825 [Verrucomicrobia bacterium]|nr:hypothetical protein [Verrucomicrobiota bacterium]MCF7708531.1 hypothetical protein [Verrucomicrobiota bacterium]
MSGQFGDLVPSELYCPKCRTSRPVAEKLLLLLPDGRLFDYFCRHCGTSLGKRKVSGDASGFQSAMKDAPGMNKRLHRR